ncbi:MAG: hypothetical protein LW875_11990 [Proteobacteria bacterium]|jgi:hypothetical protein|nr:hypothetical protein [Pseudomonadota bacterium]
MRNWIQWFFVLSLLCPGFTQASQLLDEERIIGTWKYVGFIYEDHRYSPPNPKLHVLFTFSESHNLRLYWEYEGEPGNFCESRSSYLVKDSFFRKETYWLNPDNHFSCGQDPDMQLGKVTTNRIFFQPDNELHLLMALNGKDFFYVLKRQ